MWFVPVQHHRRHLRQPGVVLAFGKVKHKALGKGQIASLQQQHGVSIESATVGAAAAPGFVNATLSLKHAGAAG